MDIFEKLSKSAFRSKFRLKDKDLKYINEKGIDINNIQSVRVVPYIYNMQEIMNYADLVVSRSGAMTVTEISIVGKPAIFIPLPSKMANRQEDNALVLKNAGAAEIISNESVNFQNLSITIDKLIDKITAANLLNMAFSSLSFIGAL